jgi:hypothetical protein
LQRSRRHPACISVGVIKPYRLKPVSAGRGVGKSIIGSMYYDPDAIVIHAYNGTKWVTIRNQTDEQIIDWLAKWKGREEVCRNNNSIE